MNLSPHKFEISRGATKSAVASFTPTIFLILDNFLIKFGDNFNIKDFHHEILKRGALPLDTLEKYINEWITDGTN